MRHFKPRIEISRHEENRLAQVRREFIAKLERLPEKQRNAVIKATAYNVLGNADPFTRAIARQMQDVLDVNERIATARNEIAQIERTDLSGFRPRDPHYREHMLARKADLESSIKADMAAAIAISEDTLEGARQDAVRHFREADARAAKSRAILEEADRLRAKAEAREISRQAQAIVNAERREAGKELLRAEDD
jgi:hypothetical protein